jgi:hypothetical protein
MVICLVGERQWDDINWNGQGHHTCVNTELGTFSRLLYPDMGSFQDAVVKMF